MKKFLLIGPLTRDTIISQKYTFRCVGGPVYYQAGVLSSLGIDTTAVVTLGREDADLLEYFPPNVQLVPLWGEETMRFENLYPDDNPNHRLQRACVSLNPIKSQHLSGMDLDVFDAVQISPLSRYDVPLTTLKHLSQYPFQKYLGAQGYLRHLNDLKVVLKPWKDSEKFLKYIDFLFLDETELSVFMPEQSTSWEETARIISLQGPEEVIITRGCRGSLIYSKENDRAYQIPAVPSKEVVDPTGLGDTYLAAYAFKRQHSRDPWECGVFASTVCSLKIEKKGTFRGNMDDIHRRIQSINI